MTDTPTPERVSDDAHELMRQTSADMASGRLSDALLIRLRDRIGFGNFRFDDLAPIAQALAAECLASRAATGAPAVEAAIDGVLETALMWIGIEWRDEQVAALRATIAAHVSAAVEAARREERERAASLVDAAAGQKDEDFNNAVREGATVAATAWGASRIILRDAAAAIRALGGDNG